jgi:ankyrin repeat protein
MAMKMDITDFEKVALALEEGGIKSILSESPSDVLDLRGPHAETLLHFFAVENRCDLVSGLAALGAVVDVENEFGNTPLMEASLLGNLEMVQCLLESGAGVAHRSSKHKATALHFALEYHKPEVAKILLLNNAPLMVSNCLGETAADLLESNGYCSLLNPNE